MLSQAAKISFDDTKLNTISESFIYLLPERDYVRFGFLLLQISLSSDNIPWVCLPVVKIRIVIAALTNTTAASDC